MLRSLKTPLNKGPHQQLINKNKIIIFKTDKNYKINNIMVIQVFFRHIFDEKLSNLKIMEFYLIDKI